MSNKKHKLTQIRSNEGWSKAFLASATGISAATIRKIEKNESVKAETIGKLVKGMNGIDGRIKDYKPSDVR